MSIIPAFLGLIFLWIAIAALHKDKIAINRLVFQKKKNPREYYFGLSISILMMIYCFMLSISAFFGQ